MTIKEIREAKHLTQQQVANVAGITSTAYARIERGEAVLTDCKYSTVMKLVDVLGNEILGGNNTMKNEEIEIVVVSDREDAISVATGFDTIEEARQYIKDSVDNDYDNLEIKYAFSSGTNKFTDFSVEDVENLVDRINSSDSWNSESLAQLCDYAGLSEEWKNADGENLEALVYKAAKILGVEI